jgi:hypothetical protein
MALDLNKLGVYRIMSIHSLEDVLTNGIYCKSEYPVDKDYPTIGNKEIISQRDRMIVKCYPDTVVNDYVPFYFSIRTPMLYNIITGHGVPKLPQREIVYVCYKLIDLATKDFQWCYTDGNAAKAITKFFTILEEIEKNVDWRSINTTDFRDNNKDKDEDRVRKKHAEFLVRKNVPANLIKAIVVLNEDAKNEVGTILSKVNMNTKVFINPDNKYYF